MTLIKLHYYMTRLTLIKVHRRLTLMHQHRDTFHYAINYGAVLFCTSNYTIQRDLTKSMICRLVLNRTG